MASRITQRDIADRLGLHVSTVARSLQDHPRIPETTRRRVQTLARKLGYSPDPMLRSLAVYRQGRQPASYHGLIAWITHGAVSQPDPGHRPYWEGAQRRAAELGYQIDAFAFHAPGMTGKRLAKILQTRNVAGILVAPRPFHLQFPARLQMDWSPFPAVAFGHSLFWPNLHRVTNNQFRTAKTVVRKLEALGYRRIGFFAWHKDHVEGSYAGGYFSEMKRWGKWPEPYFHHDDFTARTVRAWIRRERLEAIIVEHPGVAAQLIDLAKLRVPQDLGMACLSVSSAEADSFMAGMEHNLPQAGVVAVDYLVHLINTRQCGIPPYPLRLLIEGTWHPGRSVRRVNRS